MSIPVNVLIVMMDRTDLLSGATRVNMANGGAANVGAAATPYNI